MPVIESSFKTSPVINNGHLQTLYPYFFRKVEVPFKRVRLDTHDGDFIDLDVLKNDSKKLLILTHGLEGCSETSYMKGMAKKFHSEGFDIIAWNMRSCSGELNKTKSFYHAAKYQDLDFVTKYALDLGYKEISFVSFSLGGNVTAFYLAQLGSKAYSEINGAVIFSSTIDLASTVRKLDSSKFGRFYTENFLSTIREKVLKKNEIQDLGLDLHRIKNLKTFGDFDDAVTAPLHGFENAERYYREASSVQHLGEIKVPLLIVQAKDDPFLAKESYPLKQVKENPNVHLEISPGGGHVGFIQLEKTLKYWSEQRAMDFLKQAA